MLKCIMKTLPDYRVVGWSSHTSVVAKCCHVGTETINGRENANILCCNNMSHVYGCCEIAFTHENNTWLAMFLVEVTVDIDTDHVT